MNHGPLDDPAWEVDAPVLNEDWTNFSHPMLTSLEAMGGWVETYPERRVWTHDSGAWLEIDGAQVIFALRGGEEYRVPAGCQASLFLAILLVALHTDRLRPPVDVIARIEGGAA